MAGCDRKDCPREGIWMPVLELTVKGYNGPPALAVVNLRVCEQCRRKMKVMDLMTDEGWQMLCAPFEAQGKTMPTRKLTKIRWQQVPDSQVN